MQQCVFIFQIESDPDVTVTRSNFVIMYLHIPITNQQFLSGPNIGEKLTRIPEIETVESKEKEKNQIYYRMLTHESSTRSLQQQFCTHASLFSTLHSIMLDSDFGNLTVYIF